MPTVNTRGQSASVREMDAIRRRCRIPTLSRPFLAAAFIDTLGVGILLGAIQPFAGVVARRLGASPELLALLAMAPFFGFFASAGVSRLLFRFRWAWVTGMWRVFVRAMFTGFSLVAHAGGFVGLLVAVNVMAGSGQVFENSLFKAHVRDRVRSNIWPWLNAATILVSLPVAWMAGRILDRWDGGYRAVFPAAALLAVATGLLVFRLPARSAEKRTRRTSCSLGEEIRVLKEDRRLLLFMLAFFVGTLAEKIGMMVAPLYFADVLDLRYQDVGLAMGQVGPALAIGGFFFWGRCLRKTSPLTVLVICMFLKAARPMLWAMAAQLANPLAAVVVGEGFFRMAVSGIEMGVMLTLLQMSAGRQMPVYLGIHYWFLGLRGFLGPAIGVGLLRLGMDISVVYWCVAGVVVAGGIALLGFRVWNRRH